MVPWRSERLAVFWVVLAAAVAVVVVSIAEGLSAGSEQGEGWIQGPLEAVLAGGPLIAVAVGLHSARRRVARRTAIAALVLAAVVAFVLVMQLLDPNEIARDRLVQAGALLVYLLAGAVELPAFTDRWPADDQRP